MERTKYNIAIQTYMEVFDFLITNNLFAYATGEDFLSSRIRIDEYGFYEETQIRRGVWEENNLLSNKKRIPAIKVLKVLTDNIDTILKTIPIPASPNSKYAYVHDIKEKISGERDYYSSYQELLRIFKEVYNGDQLTNDTNGKITSIVLAQYKQIRESLARMTPLEKRTIECYAKLEEELTNLTIGLLLRDEFEREVTYPNSEMYSDPDYHFASKDNYVDWKEFKECITDIYECRLEDDSFDMHGVYSPWDKNPYKSELGLDGMTK